MVIAIFSDKFINFSCQVIANLSYLLKNNKIVVFIVQNLKKID